MLDDEQTSQEAKEAIVKRPGVVESIVATATRALPPAEEAALQARGCDLDQTTENSVSAQTATKALVGLGREGISEAAKAVVGVLEDNDDWAKKQAAMATMRTLIDSEVACEESAVLSDDDDEPPGALQAVRGCWWSRKSGRVTRGRRRVGPGVCSLDAPDLRPSRRRCG